jgi:hypothetical protein
MRCAMYWQARRKVCHASPDKCEVARKVRAVGEEDGMDVSTRPSRVDVENSRPSGVLLVEQSGQGWNGSR